MAGSVEKTYGDALFQLVLEETPEQLSDVLTVLREINHIFAENSDYIKLIKTPTVTADEKLQLINQAFKGKVCESVYNFLLVLVQNKRLDYFDKIYTYFLLLHNDYKNIADITVTTTVPLSEALKEKLIGKMSLFTGKTINLSEKIDKSIIGGIVISYGNTQIDGSVKARLEALKNDIANTIA